MALGHRVKQRSDFIILASLLSLLFHFRKIRNIYFKSVSIFFVAFLDSMMIRVTYFRLCCRARLIRFDLLSQSFFFSFSLLLVEMIIFPRIEIFKKEEYFLSRYDLFRDHIL